MDVTYQSMEVINTSDDESHSKATKFAIFENLYEEELLCFKGTHINEMKNIFE
jgi:hypothetical protein